MHPFDDDDFIAGNATMGSEIIEDLPDVAKSLSRRWAAADSSPALQPACARQAGRSSVLVAEPETAAPASLSFAAGRASSFRIGKPSFVDGAGGKSVFPRMWERMQALVDGSRSW